MSKMDEKRSGYSLKMPGSSGGPLHLPGQGFPRIDDHLVQPEVTRDEIINGRRVVAFPADPPHATQHGDLHYVLRAHVAPGYRGAVDLLTRQGQKSDFASDACVYKDGIDPLSSARYLEEMAFEVVSEQSDRDVTEKAVGMHRRGVRRIFAAFVKGPRLCEWSPKSRSWRPLDGGSRIEDPCLAVPLPIGALLDAALADNAVAEALIAKGNPTILNLEATAEARGEAKGKTAGWAEGRAAGRAEGMAESILRILEARGVAVSPAQREEILCCSDFDRLDRWLLRATLASSVNELTSEP
ncbi:MAG: hypothetical protein QOF89_4547 [Acidobacteriota bacterium]|jgi:hypothetical protein|nr:hypothetical protein [Acidobacteriota bacterium]